MKIDEIARVAKVSRSTVSRVLNGNPNVRKNTREAVERVIREQNYVPNAAARSLASKRAGVVGVVLQNISQPYWAGLFAQIEQELRHNGYGVLVSGYSTSKTASSYLGDYQAVLRNLLIQNVDGIIIALANDLDGKELDILRSTDKPFVVIQSSVSDSDILRVNIDNVKTAETLTNYLLDCGHVSICHAAGPTGSSIARDRLQGFINAMNAHHIQVDDGSIINCGSMFEDGYWCMQRIIKKKKLPTAVFFQNDISAYGGILAANEQGIRIPEDISVAGIDRLSNMLDVSGLLPDLTSMEMPISGLGNAAGKMIIDIIEKDARPENALLSCELHEGRTVRNLLKG